GQGAQRQGDPRLHRQRGMAAGEDQPEPFVGHAVIAARVRLRLRLVGSGIPGCHHGQLLDLGPVGAATPQAVDGPVAGHRHQPRPRAVRHAAGWPAPQRLGEGVLRALLGQVPVARLVDQGRGDAAPLLAEGAGHHRPHDAGRGDGGGGRRFGGLRELAGAVYSSSNGQNGLTSSRPRRAIGCLRAIAIASSRSAHSSTSKPATCSFVSANGPSVTIARLFRTRTVRAWSGGASSLPYRRAPRPSISATQGSTGSMWSNSRGSTAGSVQTSIMYLLLPASGLGRGTAGALSGRARTSTTPARECGFSAASRTASSRLSHSSRS